MSLSGKCGTVLLGATLLPTASGAQVPCLELSARAISPDVIYLPSRGVQIQSVGLIDSPPACVVVGTIAPVDPTAPLITFQVNLPEAWNGKAVQYGGGGFNGTLVTGRGPALDAPPDLPSPLRQGYVTFGTDSGHRADQLPEPQAFALNAEALENFAYASYRKVRDVAVELITRRYGPAPSRLYYMGSSEGGREGIAMAQLFPADYDGVISRVPVLNWTALQHAGHRIGLVQQADGWLSPANVVTLSVAVLGACDELDGLVDGIVSNYLDCAHAFDPATLRCPGGTDDGVGCLSSAQLATVEALHAPYEFPFSLANDMTTYPPYGYGGEAQPGAYDPWVTGGAPPTFPSNPGSPPPRLWSFGSGAIRYFVLQDPEADPLTYSPTAHQERIRQISALMDATDPDLSAFAGRGGKLIIKEHTADYAQSPFAGIAYYESVVATMTQTVVEEFVRLYVSPGLNHAGAGVTQGTNQPLPNYVDLIGTLDRWVEHGEAPGDLIETSVDPGAVARVIGSRPLCRFPTYPRYRGSGDTSEASSYACTAN